MRFLPSYFFFFFFLELRTVYCTRISILRSQIFRLICEDLRRYLVRNSLKSLKWAKRIKSCIVVVNIPPNFKIEKLYFFIRSSLENQLFISFSKFMEIDFLKKLLNFVFEQKMNTRRLHAMGKEDILFQN